MTPRKLSAADVSEIMPRIAPAETKPPTKAPSKPRVTKEAAVRANPFPVIARRDEPVDARAFLHQLRGFLQRYLILPDHAAEAITLWIVHTYLIGIADYTPYLLVSSPVRECGKSTLLELLQHLAYRAQYTGGITAAALYRRIDRLQPTFLIDELDTRLRGDGGEALRGVLNTGFHRNGKVTVCSGDNHDERDFGTFCAKVLAGIGRPWDTVVSRAIPIRLNRATREELQSLTRIRGDRIGEVCRPYQEGLLRLAEDIEAAVRESDPEVPERLSARQSDVWRPLLGIADAVGGDWPQLARVAARALHDVPEPEGDVGLLLLADVRDFLVQQGHPAVVSSADLLTHLVTREDRPWPEYRNHRDPLSARGLASLFGRFDVSPRTHRSGASTVKGYSAAELSPLFEKYLPTPPSGASVTSVTSVTSSESQSAGGVTDVTDTSGGVGRSGPWLVIADDGALRNPERHRVVGSQPIDVAI